MSDSDRLARGAAMGARAPALLALFVALVAGATLAAAETEPLPYPLRSCIVSGEMLSVDGALSHVHGDQEMRFCCEGCLAKFQAEPEDYLAKMRAAVIADQMPLYPLDTCPVSGAELGSMGEPVDYLHRNRLVRFCCDGCRGAFEKDPTGFLEKLDQAAIARQLPAYPLETCVVSGMKLGSMGPAIDHIHNGRLVRFCCAGCLPTFQKDPWPLIEKIDAAAEAEEAPQKSE